MASTISKAASGRGSLSIRLRRDSYPLLFIMTSVGGFCASYSFLARGGVFAFAQTGNIIYSGHVMASGTFSGRPDLSLSHSFLYAGPFPFPAAQG